MRGQKGDRVYLRELKSSVRQQRRDPVGTFGHVTVELGRRLYCVLRHDLVDVLYSSLRDKTQQLAPWSQKKLKSTNAAKM